MVIQSRPLQLLMTRPKMQGMRFARQLRQGMQHPLRVTYSPLIQPVFLCPPVPHGTFAAVIFTSETGVQAAHRMKDLPHLAFCVGDQTAHAARKAGFVTVSAVGDADALVARILQDKTTGPLLHICGQDTRGDVAKRLSSAGTETVSLISYRQDAVDLTPAAHRLLARKGPIIVPLFSPRTAHIFLRQAEPFAAAQLYIAALSPAVADAAGAVASAAIQTAVRPTADAMIAAIQQIADALPVA